MEQKVDKKRDYLQRLPLEPQHKIFGLLDYPAAIFLTATCRSLRDSPKSPLSFQSGFNKEQFLIAHENSSYHVTNQGYACFRCHVIKPYDQFAKKQISGKQSKLHERCEMRFCIDCGLQKNIYTRGQQVRKVDGVLYWKCYFCPQLKSGLYCGYCTKCQDCLRLPVGFEGNVCPCCGKPRIQGEKRVIRLNQADALLALWDHFFTDENGDLENDWAD